MLEVAVTREQCEDGEMKPAALKRSASSDIILTSATNEEGPEGRL